MSEYKYAFYGMYNDLEVHADVRDLSTFVNAGPDAEICVYYFEGFEDLDYKSMVVKKGEVNWTEIES